MSRIRSLVREIADWSIPLRVQALALRRATSFSNFMLAKRHKELLSRNTALKGRHSGQRCFILGTGPSITEQDLSPLENEICIALSNFTAHTQYDLISPAYYCVAPMHEPYTDEDGARWFADLQEKAGATTMIMSASDQHLISRNALFTKQELHYLSFYNRSGRETFGLNFSDLSRPLPRPQTVALMALSTARYLGFNEIYLLGLDHSWPAHLGESRHFYDEKQKRLGAENWASEIDHESFFNRFAVLMWKYKALYRDARREGIEIFNATPGSLIDAFPSVHFESLFQTQDDQDR